MSATDNRIRRRDDGSIDTAFYMAGARTLRAAAFRDVIGALAARLARPWRRGGRAHPAE